MGGPKWKREVFQDHKFDYIDVKSFTSHGVLLWAGYLWVYIDILKSAAVYVLDTQTAIFLLAFNKWASQVKPAVSLSISRWIFSGCIIFSFLLLAKDWWTAKKIIRSRDISFAYTNLIANRWYSVRGGYAYFCLFDQIGDSRHAWDSIAFFVFFSFKGWKRLLLAEGPRQVLNAITLYSVAKGQNFSFDIHQYQEAFTTIQGVVMSFMLLTVTIWALSFIRLLVAGLLYWPLLVCNIRGNLKEYCCHKVDKRITQMLADRRRRRFDPTPEQKRDSDNNTPDSKFRPTLPNVELDGDGASIIAMPLYPLSRTNTADSRRGLLTRTESVSTIDTQRYLTRTPTNMSNPYTLNRTDTNVSDPRSLNRTDTNVSNPHSLHRTDTNISNPQSLHRNDSDVRDFPPLQKQPTLPHLAGDFAIPQRPARIDPRGPPRSGPTSARSYGPPSAGPSSARSNFGPPSRSNTGARMEPSFGPPPRSNTFDGVSATPRRPERPFDPNTRGYPVPR